MSVVKFEDLKVCLSKSIATFLFRVNCGKPILLYLIFSPTLVLLFPQNIVKLLTDVKVRREMTLVFSVFSAAKSEGSEAEEIEWDTLLLKIKTKWIQQTSEQGLLNKVQNFTC